MGSTLRSLEAPHLIYICSALILQALPPVFYLDTTYANVTENELEENTAIVPVSSLSNEHLTAIPEESNGILVNLSPTCSDKGEFY